MIIALLTVVLLQIPIPTFEPMQSPTPIPTVTPINVDEEVDLRSSDIYNSLATAEGALREAPENLTTAGYLPDETGYQLFSYMKWAFGSSTAEEIAGPFAVFINRLSVIMGMYILLGIIYFIIFIARFIIRFIQWVITTILKFVPFFG